MHKAINGAKRDMRSWVNLTKVCVSSPFYYKEKLVQCLVNQIFNKICDDYTMVKFKLKTLNFMHLSKDSIESVDLFNQSGGYMRYLID